ncbi:putative segregation protein [Campylobacter sputorum subsp. sputorum]|nr:putative segregation protein [Campylobacter sputorum subsp. sputorum]
MVRFLLTFLTLLAASLFGAICYVFYDTKISQVSVKENIQTNHNELKFSDLPLSIQKDYINKNDLSEYGDYITPYSYALNFEINSNDGEVVGSNDELKAQIIALRNHNKLLYIDNIDLANKNWEAILRLRDQKKDMENEKKEFLDKNLKLLRQAQDQHYKNIDELTKRLNDVQLSSMQNSKIYEQKIVELKNEIEIAQKILRDKEVEFSQKLSNITSKEKQNNSSLSQKNSYLLEQLEELKSKNAQNLELLAKQAKEIDKQKLELKQTIDLKDTQINDILSKHTMSIADLEKKNKIDLSDLRTEFEKQKDKFIKDLESKEEEIKNLGKIALEEKQSYTNQISGLEDRLAKTLVENKNLKDKSLEKKYLSMLREQNLTISNLQNELKKINDKNESLIISNLEERIKLKDNQILSLNQKMDKFKDDNKTTKGIIDKNYKLLNEKIASLQNEKTSLQNSLNATINKLNDEIKNLKEENSAKALNSNLALNYGLKTRKYEDKIKTLTQKLNDIKDEKQNSINLKKENDKLKAKLENLNKTKKGNFEIEVIKSDKDSLALKEKNQELLSDINKLKNQLLNSEKLLLDVINENEKLRINRISSTQTSDIIAKYEKSLQSIKELEIENGKLRHDILSLDKNSIEKIAPKKAVNIDSISCEDLNSKNQPSVMCKNLVSEFLQKYNSNFSFVVIPINSSSSVKAVSQKLRNSGISNVDKISNYALG